LFKDAYDNVTGLSTLDIGALKNLGIDLGKVADYNKILNTSLSKVFDSISTNVSSAVSYISKGTEKLADAQNFADQYNK